MLLIRICGYWKCCLAKESAFLSLSPPFDNGKATLPSAAESLLVKEPSKERNAMDPLDDKSHPVRVEFSPKEFMGLVETARVKGFQDVHAFVLDAAHQQEAEEMPSNILPFPTPPGSLEARG